MLQSAQTVHTNFLAFDLASAANIYRWQNRIFNGHVNEYFTMQYYWRAIVSYEHPQTGQR